MTQPIHIEQPLGSIRDGLVFATTPWFRYFVDVGGSVNLSQGVTGTLAIANGGTGTTAATGTGSVVLSNTPSIASPVLTGTSVIQAIAQVPMNAPVYQNGWADLGGANQVGGYYKDSFGVVHLRGVIISGTIGLTAFTLPAGFRPLANEVFAVASNTIYGQLAVKSDGTVIPAVGSNLLFSLSGVSFRTDA